MLRKEAGMETQATLKEGQDVGGVGCGMQPSEGEHSASPADARDLCHSSYEPGLATKPPPSFTPLPEAVSRDTSANGVASPYPSDGPSPDMECLICFNRYSLGRLPKCLACQHVFCAVCLKLILRNDGHTWRILCPVCREATPVFGGLICSLRNEEAAFGRLVSTGANPEVLSSLGAPGGLQLSPGTFYILQDEDNRNRVATKRLLFLLLFLMVVLILALPFMYTGLLQWALCFVVVLGLVIAGVLCCNPKWSFSDVSLPSWRKRGSHVTSVA